MMQRALKRLVWVDGRFSWTLVVAVVLGTALLLYADYFWRTNETNLSAWF